MKRKARPKALKRRRPKAASRKARSGKAGDVIRDPSHYARLTRTLAELNSCTTEEVTARALMAGLEYEALRTHTAIADGACPHCYGKKDSPDRAKMARSRRKAKTAEERLSAWSALPMVEFMDKMAE